MSRQATFLIRVGIGRSDGGHKTDSPFRAIPKFPRIITISAVVIMGVDDGIGDTHQYDSLLEAS